MYSKNIMRVIIMIWLVIITPLLAYSQSDTHYDAGMNLPFNRKAGDVNPQTGNFTLSFTDLALPGRAGMHFTFGQGYIINVSSTAPFIPAPSSTVYAASKAYINTFSEAGHIVLKHRHSARDIRKQIFIQVWE